MSLNPNEHIRIRLFRSDSDDIEQLTDLLHKSYQQLADMGLRYLAAHQDSTVTRRRIVGAHCLVAEAGKRIVATITYYHPGRKSDCPWYSNEGVGVFGQFGVLPDFQGTGIGSRLLEAVEERARQDGCRELALDTAAPALHLQAYYQERGYRVVDHVDWENTNYRSVIMSKELG